jgi:acetylornithine/succinyldiaminopimelate/putrescine aminotransferase
MKHRRRTETLVAAAVSSPLPGESEVKATDIATSLVPPFPSATVTEAAYTQHMGPSMARLMAAIGTPIHYGKRQGARVQDAYTGKWYWDCHRNGSLYNLGHRNPEVLEAVGQAMRQLEIGNLFLCSGHKAAAAAKLVASTGGELTGVTFAASGSEANEVAIRAARGFTRRRKLVSLKGSYHGSSCFAMATGDSPDLHQRYLLDFPDFIKVPYNDVAALRAVVDKQTACVLIEASPAQLGFPVPEPGYFDAVRKICDDNGAVFILDEVQTGLGSSGWFWLWQQQGVAPDIMTTAKGLGGGIMPNAALLMAPAIKDWFLDTEFPHMSTFGGNELGCVATSSVCDITSRPDFSNNVLRLIEQFREGFGNAPFRVNQVGLCMGLLSESMDSFEMTRKLFAAGVLVLPAHYEPRAIEFRPVLILDENEAESIIRVVRDVLG